MSADPFRRDLKRLEKDLDTLEKVKAALIDTDWNCGDLPSEIADAIIARIPDAPASAPTPKRDDAGVREAVYRIGYTDGFLDGGDGMLPKERYLRQAWEENRDRALAAHPAPSEPEGEALRGDWSDVIEDLAPVILESDGVAGWHLNGAVEPWARILSFSQLARIEAASKPQPEAPAAPSGETRTIWVVTPSLRSDEYDETWLPGETDADHHAALAYAERVLEKVWDEYDGSDPRPVSVTLEQREVAPDEYPEPWTPSAQQNEPEGDDALRSLGLSMVKGVPTYARVPGCDGWAEVTASIPVSTWHAAVAAAKLAPSKPPAPPLSAPDGGTGPAPGTEAP